MIEDRINISKTLEEKIPTIIEVFTKYYGEEERERITNIFNSVTYVGYLDNKAISSLISDYTDQVYTKGSYRFLEAIGVEATKENFKRFFTSKIDGFGDALGDFYDYLDSGQDWKKGYALRSIEQLFGEKVELDSPEYEKYKEIMLGYRDKYEQAVKECNEELQKIDQFIQYGKELKQLEQAIKRKYTAVYLKKISEHLSEHDKSIIEESDKTSQYDCAGLLIGYSYDSKCLVDAFSEENEEKLKNPKVSDFNKESIKKDRVQWYNKHGLDLGSEYEDYLDSDVARKLTPSFEFVESIINTRTETKQEEKNEMVKSFKHLEPLLAKIKAVGLENHNYGLYEVVRDNSTCIVPNFIVDGENIIIHPLFYINGGTSLDSLDCRIIHECNHIYELAFLGYDGEGATMTSGWDICNEKVSHTDMEDMDNSQAEHRPYEMLNEIINELLAQDITTLMHENGIYLYGDETVSKNTSLSSYGFATRLVWDFFSSFKPEIIASRKDYNMDILFNKVGEENFMELNQLIKDYLEYFSGFKPVNVMTAIEEGRENDDTRYYFECVENAKRITANMHNFQIEDGFRL